MTNELTTINTFNIQVPTIPEAYKSLMDSFDEAFDDFSGTFRTISFNNQREFVFNDGGSTSIQPSNEPLWVVILGMSPHNFYKYWPTNYKAGQESKPPLAEWYSNMERPSVVPASAMVKDPTDGYTKCTPRRRLVVAIFRKNGNEVYLDLDNPYTMDVGSMTILGDDMPELNALSLRNLVQLCKRFNVKPCMFATRLIYDTRVQVASIRFIPATDRQSGNMSFLDQVMLENVFRVASSPSVTELTKVKMIFPGVEQIQQVSTPAPVQAPMQSAPMQSAPMQSAPMQSAPMQSAPVEAYTFMPATEPDLMQQAASASQAAVDMLSTVNPAGPAENMDNALADILKQAGAYNG